MTANNNDHPAGQLPDGWDGPLGRRWGQRPRPSALANAATVLNPKDTERNTVMATPSKIAVFRVSDWHSPSPGRWEAAAAPQDCEGPPPFEATCTNPEGGLGDWYWTIYQANPNTGELQPLTHGLAPTLTEAKRQADHHARRWRDNEPIAGHHHRLANLDEHSTVTCDACDTTHNLATLLHSGGHCDSQREDGDRCNSTDFDGNTIDALAEAVIR